VTHGADGPEIIRDAGPDADEPDLPLTETDVKSAARSCSVILLIAAAVVAIAVVALVIALING